MFDGFATEMPLSAPIDQTFPNAIATRQIKYSGESDLTNCCAKKAAPNGGERNRITLSDMTIRHISWVIHT